jgi:hypothetical protein
VDNRYGAAIATLHTNGYAAVTTTIPNRTTSVMIQNVAYNVSSSCTPGSNAVVTTIAGDTFFNCNDFAPKGTVILTGQHFVFAGTLSVNNQGNNTPTLSLPNAKTVYVRGCTSGCTGSNNYAISVQGNLYVNNNKTDGTTQSCANLKGPGDGGTYTNIATIATFSGPFLVTGIVSLCQTTVYLGANSATYAPEELTGPTVAPEFCSANLPCPAGSLAPPTNGDSTGMQYINITGGSGYADWSAPDQNAGLPPAGTLDQLALWEESDQPSSITGQGSNRTVGVYFAPNSAFTFTGQATQTQPLNAQFIARTLTISGQSTLYLVGPPNYVPTVPQTLITLIR